MSSHQSLLDGLALAVDMLFPLEPPDSRAVSNEFVALAALSTGDDSPAIMKVIHDALAKKKAEFESVERDRERALWDDEIARRNAVEIEP